MSPENRENTENSENRGGKGKKQRVDFRKNRNQRTRLTNWTREFEEHGFEEQDPIREERISGKGDLVRRRTIMTDSLPSDKSDKSDKMDKNDDLGFESLTSFDPSKCRLGRVLRVHGLNSFVEDENGNIFQCITRRLLKTMSTDQRHVVVAGDRVLFRESPQNDRFVEPDVCDSQPLPSSQPQNQHNSEKNRQNGESKKNSGSAKNGEIDKKRGIKRNTKQEQNVEFEKNEGSGKNTSVAEGIIERVEPRTGALSRMSKHRKQLIVTNVDQAVIVASAAEPPLKPNLIDRILVTSERSGIRPIICINKIDLVNPAELQPLIGVYAQMGYTVLTVSATTGFGIERLKRVLQNRESVLTGQSGVGKSSLLNSLEPGLALRVGEISHESGKGTHTTTTAELLRLSFGGYVVDTPGIRQFMLWNIIPEEVLGFYRDLRPYENHCHFPNCTHTYEMDCAVKNAAADGRVDMRRYESFVSLREPKVERPNV
ncbi:MAG: ribosome small subunit-dependent GTPase A [Thermoguttaceae bacterium]